ncbi:hypothetical protein Pmani_020355 [Petrolisthes manimaculis]|uniref:Uncharacterized protein n=1 Tax=Petrolisthes manimaculis TaxID=1843537 RepID=A0AAE1U349_9EUCA|nr:hypothetical protein Pmani_020355 [Petrolisthes manimaculis]
MQVNPLRRSTPYVGKPLTQVNPLRRSTPYAGQPLTQVNPLRRSTPYAGQPLTQVNPLRRSTPYAGQPLMQVPLYSESTIYRYHHSRHRCLRVLGNIVRDFVVSFGRLARDEANFHSSCHLYVCK